MNDILMQNQAMKEIGKHSQELVDAALRMKGLVHDYPEKANFADILYVGENVTIAYESITSSYRAANKIINKDLKKIYERASEHPKEAKKLMSTLAEKTDHAIQHILTGNRIDDSRQCIERIANYINSGLQYDEDNIGHTNIEYVLGQLLNIWQE